MIKVLVVEDEELIRKGIILTVDWASLGCVVAGSAANGEEGLAEAEKIHPGLIVTDIKMPKMDGIEFVRKLREKGYLTDVIILTAYDSFEYAQSALRLGAVDFLVKPFHDGELEAAVLRLRKRHEKEKASENVFAGEKSDRAAAEPDLQALALPDPDKNQMSRYVTEAVNYLADHYGDSGLTVGEVAEALGISEGHLSHTFKKETSMTFSSYLTRYRMRKAIGFLKSGKYRVYEVADMVGYRDLTYFSATFKKITGVSPSEYVNP